MEAQTDTWVRDQQKASDYPIVAVGRNGETRLMVVVMCGSPKLREVEERKDRVKRLLEATLDSLEILMVDFGCGHGQQCPEPLENIRHRQLFGLCLVAQVEIRQERRPSGSSLPQTCRNSVDLEHAEAKQKQLSMGEEIRRWWIFPLRAFVSYRNHQALLPQMADGSWRFDERGRLTHSTAEPQDHLDQVEALLLILGLDLTD